MNFETDAYDLIKQMSQVKSLDPAARLAGQQLELMKPAMMAPTKRGFYIGPAAYVDRGYVVLVIADAAKVITIRFLSPDCGTAELLREWADYVKSTVPSESSWEPSSTAVVAKEALKKYGAKPGKKGRQFNQEISARIVAAMFACYSPDQ
jgi:hypothetical protein